MARKKSAADQQQVKQEQENGNTHEGNVFQGEDFFQGKCIRLKEISTMQDNIITEYGQNARREFNVPFDKIRIEKARHDFRNKDFKKCLAAYENIVNREFMNDLDVKLIEFSESQIKV